MFSILSKTKILIGVEIKQNYIRFIEMKRSNNEDHIVSYGEVVFESILFEKDVFVDEKTLIGYLKNIRKDVSGKEFIVSLPSNVNINSFSAIFKEAGIKVSRFVKSDDALHSALVPKDSETSFLLVDAEKDIVSFLIHNKGEKIFFYEGAPENHFVVTNLNQIYVDWYDDHKEKIHNVIFSGSRVNDSGFLDYVGRGTKIPILLGNVLVNLKLHENKIPIIPKEETFKYAVAIGLTVC
jgi:hypothetical protein